jgi:hypothetical protein
LAGEEFRTRFQEQAVPFLEAAESARDVAAAAANLGRSADLYIHRCMAYCLGKAGETKRKMLSTELFHC